MESKTPDCSSPCSKHSKSIVQTTEIGSKNSFGANIKTYRPASLLSVKTHMIKTAIMLVSVYFFIVVLSACETDKETPFTLLTEPVWVSDSLLVNGMNAGGPGQLLANFNGEARFLPDGTGLFANFTGTWRFAQNDTKLIITSPDYPVPITTKIEELSRSNLRISTELQNPLAPGTQMRVRMTFKSRR